MGPSTIIFPLVLGTACQLWLTKEANSSVVKEEFWQHQFNFDFVKSGVIFTASASTASACANVCKGFPRCKSFGFNSGSHTCWLYENLVSYISGGYTAAPGTRYFWRLSPRCPTELGYTLEGGLCFKIHRENLAWSTTQNVCAGEGGIMFIADTVAKLDILKNHVTSQTWVGGSGANRNAGRRWPNGRVMDVTSPIWLPERPGSNTVFCVGTAGRVYDVSPVSGNFPAACEVPML